ncbi:hypothetical protein ACS5PN_30680 [Roseateles sp. NT4]|uniref:hypothetical protein n=1 Tax=Roseateles sp. NT4 TaxID=3453715 RepID=UPI003EEAE474
MRPLLLVLVLALTLPVLAQTQTRSAAVYRCGPEGRDLRDSPCPGSGTAGNIEYDQPSNADSKAARERHFADARQAAVLAQARRASEAEARHQRAQAVGLQSLPPPAQPASSPPVTHLTPPKTAKAHKPSAAASHPR